MIAFISEMAIVFPIHPCGPARKDKNVRCWGAVMFIQRSGRNSAASGPQVSSLVLIANI